MRITPTEIPDVLHVEPKVFRDDRGLFYECFREDAFRAAGVDVRFVQHNQARSVAGTLRGLHFQSSPGQAKLVRATRGRVWDVAVDIRPGSPTFRRWVARELSADNCALLYVPVGFAHGYAALEDADVHYLCSAYYDPKTESGIAWNDPDIGVAWPIAEPLLSARDQKAPLLRDLLPAGAP
ncbi:MAG: dTDP-4-dehydrorhamnose 3,5-epimerase [Myxococcales bacterium]|nr:dTDP-4-dehydrorhamnose 3,5-epimerase [Myxococcales bacterium]